MTERGRILRDTRAGPGLISIEGRQHTFTLEGTWRSDVPPRVGMFVDVTFRPDGETEAVHAVSDAQIAKEQAHKALSGALQHGKSVQGGLLKRFGVLSALAVGLLLIAFFLLPNVQLGRGPYATAISGWGLTGLNPATMMTTDHGVMSLLALVCLFAPFAVAFLKTSWARWLYAAPLVFTVLNLWIAFSNNRNQSKAVASAVGDAFGRDAARMAESVNPNALSLAAGTYIVLVCGLYLATRSFRSTTSMDAAA